MNLTNSYLYSFILIITLGEYVGLCEQLDFKDIPEELFLDIAVSDILNGREGLQVFEPWATRYINAVYEKKFGEAIWARYHMMGDVHNNVVDGTNLTVLDSIREDAMEYKANSLEDFHEAVNFYNNPGIRATDAHTDILDIISEVNHQDVSHLVERATFGIKCSGDWLASADDCSRLIRTMSRRKTYLRNDREVHAVGTCHLRLGKYRRGGDVTYRTAFSVASLIDEHCSRVPRCCNTVKVSGSSPKNSGHRKICLSAKSTGCS